MSSTKKNFQSPLKFPTPSIARYQAEISRQQQLLKIVKQTLPNELALHTAHCVLSNHKLIIYTDSAAWAAQLRFYHSTILNHLQSSGWQSIQLIQFRILQSTQQPAKRKPIIPNQENINAIRQQIKATDKDALSRSLKKLCDILEIKSKQKTQ